MGFSAARITQRLTSVFVYREYVCRITNWNFLACTHEPAIGCRIAIRITEIFSQMRVTMYLILNYYENKFASH